MLKSKVGREHKKAIVNEEAEETRSEWLLQMKLTVKTILRPTRVRVPWEPEPPGTQSSH